MIPFGKRPNGRRALTLCCCLLLWCAAGGSALAQSYEWRTLAGWPGGPGISDGEGVQAHFNAPVKVAADAAGNIYVADRDNHTIRRVTPAGVVSTLAGMAGSPGSSNGQGSAARFNAPAALCVDPAGGLYVADTGNHIIRRITPEGVVSTVAGQAGIAGSADGAAARFDRPGGIAIHDGTVYIADTGNHTIRRLNQDGTVITLAGSAPSGGSADGTGSVARFNQPGGIAVDGAGGIVVADMANHTIRRVTPAGEVSTLAGLALSPGSANGAGPAARFFRPADVCVLPGGDFLIADSLNNLVRSMTPFGVVTNLAGTTGAGHVNGPAAAANFSNPLGVAVDRQGVVYVADETNDALRKIAGGTVTTLAGGSRETGNVNGTGTQARWNTPTGIVQDPAGNLFVSEFEAHTIRRISTAGVVTSFAGSAGNAGSTDATGTSARFNSPAGMAMDASGNIYVADALNHTIRRITPAGAVTTFAGTAGASGSANGTGSAARFNGPRGITLGSSGFLYVTDFDNHTIRKISSTGVVTTLAGSAGSQGSSNGTGGNARFRRPVGITFYEGNVYVADSGNATIRRVNDAGVVTTIAGSAGTLGAVDGTGTAATFRQPAGIGVDAMGNLFVADSSTNGLIRRVTLAGVVTTVGGALQFSQTGDGVGTAARFFNPNGISVSPSGIVQVADYNNARIVEGRPITSPPAIGTDVPWIEAGSMSAVKPWGDNGNDTLGQTFVAPPEARLSRITVFAARDRDSGPTGEFRFGVHIMRWNGNRAVGPVLFASALQRTTNTGDTVLPRFDIPAGGLDLTPGERYVLIASTATPPAGAGGAGKLGFAVSSNNYSGGEFVTQSGGSARWTTDDWTKQNPVGDMAFRLEFAAGEIGVRDVTAAGTPELINGQTAWVNVGSVRLGTTQEYILQILNTGIGDLRIASVTAPPGFTVANAHAFPVSLSPGQSQTLRLAVLASVTGVFLGPVTVSSSDFDEPSFVFPVRALVVAPQIAVHDGPLSGPELTDGQTSPVSFGVVRQGGVFDREFVFQNTGDAPLLVSEIAIEPPAGGPALYSLRGVPQLPLTVVVGAWARFTVRLNATAPGDAGAVIRIISDAANSASFDFPVAATVVTPEIALHDGTATDPELADGQTVPVDFGTPRQETPAVRSFTVTNTGTAPLLINGIAVPAGFATLNAPAFPASVNAGSALTLRIQLLATSLGTFAGNVSIASDDLDETSFDFPVTGLVVSPEIVLHNGDNASAPELIDGQTAAVDFGRNIQGTPASRTFSIGNTGTVELLVSAVTAPAGYELQGLPPLPFIIGIGQTRAFQVSLTALTVGTHAGSVVIASDDLDEANFDFPVTGAVFIPDPAATAVSTATTLNRQTGLREQTIHVTNETTATVPAYNLIIRGLPAGVEVNNASSQREDGSWVIYVRQTMNPRTAQDVLVEYFSPTRVPAEFTPQLSTEVVLEPPGLSVPGDAAAFRIDVVKAVAGGVMIEFPATPGLRYQVQYSSDGTNWQASLPSITAAANRTLWMDRGLPRTDSPPSSNTSRFYRVVELSP